jgi:tetratricopeptide repeat protein
VAGQPYASRVLVSVAIAHPLPLGDRAAIIYQDAHSFFAGAPDAAEAGPVPKSPQSLEEAVWNCVLSNAPDVNSVERAIRHVYSDLYRCLYRSCRTQPAETFRFYLRRLRGQPDRAQGEKSAWRKWHSEPWRKNLRRDLIWLFCGHDAPDTAEPAVYLDPFDYACWALRTRAIPATLVGRSHGDLHGRNVIVGVQRGEAEYPAVYDYGDMRDENVLVWDFVKLEMELKVRLVSRLYENADIRDALLPKPGSTKDESVSRRRHSSFQLAVESGPNEERALRCHQAAFAFAFETLLDQLTDCIQTVADTSALHPPGVYPPGNRRITGSEPLDRALSVLLRIRQEAALCLGDWQIGRTDRNLWRPEYYFALVVYGLNVAKFKTYETPEYLTNFALVSAGVAAAELVATRHEPRAIGAISAVPSSPYASYRTPLYYGRRLWNTGRSADMAEFLAKPSRRFEHAVPLMLEYGLALTDTGQHEETCRLLAGLSDLCLVFRDFETLCRIGAACKRSGDSALADRPVPFSELSTHRAWDMYGMSYERYREAFEIAEASEKYYPGVNAATLAWFRGERQRAAEIAAAVLDSTRQFDFGKLSEVNRFWVQASRGEAALVLRKPEQAAQHYRDALALRLANNLKAAHVAFAQVCRLYWALGPEIVEPTAAVFFAANLDLPRGPLDNCGR